jgi:Electron transfer flavoprotein, beta subunit
MRIAVFVKPISINYFEKRKKYTKFEFFMNDPDRGAVIEAVKLVKNYGGEVNVFMIGNEAQLNVLKEALALGANSGILISDPIIENIDTLSKAKIIVAAIKKSKPYDVIIFGDTSIDTMHGQLGIIVADKLGLPHISNVVRIWNEDSKIVCEKRTEDKIITCEARMPMVAIVTVDLNPEYIPKTEEIESVNKPILKWDLKYLGLKPEELTNKIKLRNIERIVQNRERKFIYFNDYEELSEKIINIINQQK